MVHLRISNEALDVKKFKKPYFFSQMVLEQGTLIGQYDTAHPMIAGSARAETYKPILNQIEILNTQ